MLNNDLITKILLSIIAVGIWFNILQNNNEKQVRVTNFGNQVVPVDIRFINGWNAANAHAYDLEGEEFHSLGIRIMK